jgi:serine protease
VQRVFETAVRGFSARMSACQAELLAADPAILLVEEDQIMSINATQANATWGLDRVDQADLPLDTNYTYNDTAANVHAYVIDTGIFFTHSDFGGRAVPGFDSVGDGRNGNDCNGHGTHVAGTIGSSTYGVAKGVQLHAVRVLNCNGAGTNSGVIAGVDWITANHQSPAVANMSLGGGASNALDNAVRNAIASGVSFAVAAGNSNANACNSSPARVAQAITVGATTANDVRATFSSFGSCLDLFAPVVNITSTWNTSNTATNTISGTSMSAPHTAGVAALYLAANPTKTPAEVETALKGIAVGKVTSAGTGSPTLLLQSLFPTTGVRPTVALNNGDNVTNITDVVGGDRLYTISVPSGATNLSISSSAGTGNADIYVRLGSAPQLNAFDCQSATAGNTENCGFATPTAGVYYVMLHATADYAGVSLNVSYTPSTAANQVPVANFTTAITGLSVQFTDSSSDTDGSITGWLWNFGDGSSSVVQNPSHTYAASGSYTVTLIATDNSGASDTRSSIITVTSGQAGGQPCTTCESYTGTLSVGQTVYQPNGGSYVSNVSGVHEAWLEGAAGTNFNLTLYRQARHNRWTAVASSTGTSSSEHIVYNGTAGTYRWGLNSASGSGAFNFWMTRP